MFSRDYPISLFQALISFTGSKIQKIECDNNFPKICKFEFHQKNAKTRVLRILITIALILETLQQLIIKTRGFWAPERKNP